MDFPTTHKANPTLDSEECQPHVEFSIMPVPRGSFLYASPTCDFSGSQFHVGLSITPVPHGNLPKAGHTRGAIRQPHVGLSCTSFQCGTLSTQVPRKPPQQANLIWDPS